MRTITAEIDQYREKANLAFDRHCAQWELLEATPTSDERDIDAWISARDELHAAQAEFERWLFQ